MMTHPHIKIRAKVDALTHAFYKGESVNLADCRKVKSLIAQYEDKHELVSQSAMMWNSDLDMIIQRNGKMAKWL
jgi:hypothetical protein